MEMVIEFYEFEFINLVRNKNKIESNCLFISPTTDETNPHA